MHDAYPITLQAFLRVQHEFGSFDAHLWRFVGGKPRQNNWASITEVPARTPYAFMQAVGMVNDHTVDCFRHAQRMGLPASPSRAR